MIEISDVKHNYEKGREERFRDENTEVLYIKNNEPKIIFKLAGLISNSIGGILYLLTVFMVTQTYTGSNYPSTSWPFLVVGVTSLVGTIIGVKNIKLGSMIILLSIPATFIIGLIYIPYLGSYLYLIIYVFVPIPLPHSIFVINGGILCFLSTNRKLIS